MATRVHRIVTREMRAKGPDASVMAVGAHILAGMRWVKSPAEAALMRRSAQVSAAGIVAAAAVSEPGVLEAAAAAAHEFETRRHGAARLSYPSVAATGPNACTIHYSRLDRVIARNDLFLLDAGCELHGYVSDVTRTWPVSGQFTEAQRALYGHVLEVHQECLRGSVAGANLRDLHLLSVSMLSKAIVALGLAPNMSVAAVAKGPYRRYYPHSLGHYLGLDTHDTPSVSLTEPLRPGVVLTIEPGLYVPVDADDAPRELRGLGVRIEDDVLVTLKGPEVMSGTVPVDAAAMEALAEAGRAQFPGLTAAAAGGFYAPRAALA